MPVFVAALLSAAELLHTVNPLKVRHKVFSACMHYMALQHTRIGKYNKSRKHDKELTLINSFFLGDCIELIKDSKLLKVCTVLYIKMCTL